MEAGRAPARGGPIATLVVDDEPNIRQTLALCLRGMGCEVAQAATGAAAVDALRRRAFDLALLDLRLGADDGVDVLRSLLALSPELDVVIITAYSSVETAVEAMRRGARDYLPKPFTPAQIRALVDRTRARRDARGGALVPEPVHAIPPLETSSPRMSATLDLLRRAATHDVPVLLRGEPGTGKGVLARALHDASARRGHAFAAIPCGTLPEERLAAELFGIAAAEGDGETGWLERAAGGTVFLDDLGDLSPAMQGKLLRLLQERRFERVGEVATRIADVRVVVATARDLEGDVGAGRLRQDLLYRLNLMEIAVPALRERSEDVLPLARAFVEAFAERARRPAPDLSRAAERVLLAWPWPGNVRELRNVMERASILAPGDVIEPDVFPERLLGRAAGGPVPGGDFTAEEVEREHVTRVLARVGTLAEASRILGVDVTTLWRKRKKWAR